MRIDPGGPTCYCPLVNCRGAIPALMLVLAVADAGASERVRTENGLLSIECRDASLSGILREIAAVVPMDLWLDEGEGVEDERVSISLTGVTMKAAVEKLLESSKLNYALTLDPADEEKVVKIYVGSGGGGRLTAPVEPTDGLDEPDEPDEPDELDPEEFLESPEAREALVELKSFLEEQKAASETSENAESGEAVPWEIEELLESILDLPASSLPAEEDAPQEEANPPKAKNKEKPPQL